MNILLDSLPEAITVDGREYFADTDFRTFIILEEIILDASLEARDRIESIIDLVLPEDKPDDIEAAIDEILFLYRCGENDRGSAKRRKNGEVELKPKMIYSYDFDAPYIFGAFMTQYKIDLNDVIYMHWWKFQAMFRSLGDDNKIVEIMSYRAADLGKIKDKNERSRIAHMKQIYALPENLSFEDKVAMAGAAFGGGRF